MRATEMTAERDLEAPAERVPLQRGDHGLTHGLERGADLRRRPTGGAGPEPADVRTGHESRSRAMQDDRAHRLVRAQLLHGGIDTVAYRGCDCIDRRIVDDDHADLAVALAANRL